MKLNRKLILIAASVLAFSSCDDWLDKFPKDTVTPESYFKTATDLQLFTNPLYNNILDKTPYSEQSDQYMTQDPSNLIRGGNHRVVPNSGSGWTWTDLRRINTCLGNIDNCDDAEAVKQYSALCKFFRALFYYDKIQRFGDVPWIDHELGSAEDAVYTPRDSRELVMSHMVEDIDEAIAGLPSSYASGHNYRATKWAALALKARFCLFEGTFRKYHGISYPEHDWQWYLQQAADAAEQIINNGPFKLYSTGKPNEDYAFLFSDYDEKPIEYILSVNYDYSLEMMHNATAIALMSSQGRISTTKKFVDQYLMADGSRFTDKPGWDTMQFKEEVANRDPRLGQTIRIPGYHRFNSTKVEGPDMSVSMTGYHTAKWVMPAGNQANDKFSQAYNDLPIFRLGEVYLNYAEAKAELGTLTQADLNKSVNLLRDRVGMPHMNMTNANANPCSYLSSEKYGYPNVTGANKGVILEIRRERAVELAQEGLRYDDLLRWKAGYCLEQPIEGIYIPGAGIYDIDGDGTNDIALYNPGDQVPAKNSATFVWQIGKDVFLSEGDHGNWAPYTNIEISFDEERDYYYPIPIDDRRLYYSKGVLLTQNPKWNDGLSF